MAEVLREIGVTGNTYYRWRKEYGGMGTDQVRRLKELEVDEEREIVQCAGHNNRDPSKEEMKAVRKWAETARLKVAP